jgi:tRNA(fMet)-specific endonuclease VapC
MSRCLYMLDTNICIYITKHHPQSVMEKFQHLSYGEAVMSFITYGELVFGAQKSQHKQQALAKLQRLRKIIPVVHSHDALGETYGVIRSILERSGKPIGCNDNWIAAHALSQNYTLITNNVREFERIPKLNVENWVN